MNKENEPADTPEGTGYICKNCKHQIPGKYPTCFHTIYGRGYAHLSQSFSSYGWINEKCIGWEPKIKSVAVEEKEPLQSLILMKAPQLPIFNN